jgi:hypothetical protein
MLIKRADQDNTGRCFWHVRLVIVVHEIQSIRVSMDDIMAQLLMQYNIWNVQAETGAFLQVTQHTTHAPKKAPNRAGSFVRREGSAYYV